VLIRQAPSAFDNTFAATRLVIRAPAVERDGDGNVVPGSR
jgi:hypothetical protein